MDRGETMQMLVEITTDLQKENKRMKECIALIAAGVKHMGRDQFDNIVDLLEV